MSIPTQIEDKQKNSISYETYSYNTRQLQPQQQMQPKIDMAETVNLFPGIKSDSFSFEDFKK